MLASIELIKDDTIYAILKGDVAADDIIEMYEKTAQLMGDSQGQFFRITDVTDVDTNFAEMLQMLMKAGKQDIPGGTSDPRITVVFYGTNHWIRMVRDYLMRQHGVQIAAFDDMDEVNLHIDNLRKQSTV